MTSNPSTEQLLVQILVRSWLEALDAYATSGEESAVRQRALKQVEFAFAPLWNRLPYLELSVGPGILEWDGRAVLSSREDTIGLVETLVRSGIHGITLVPGVENREMARVLELIDRKRRLDEHGDQDLVLMLFRADLHHIRYTVGPPPKPRIPEDGGAAPTEATGRAEAAAPDPPAHSGATAVREAEAEKRRRAVLLDAASTDGPEGIVRLEDFDSTLYFLDAREIEYLRTSIEREYAQDHSQNVLALLLDILEVQEEYEVQAEVVGILKTLLPYLLGTGRFPAVAYMTSELRRITRGLNLAPELKQSLDELRTSISLNDALTQLFHVLDDGTVDPSAEELGVLLREMQQDAIRTVLVWIGQLNRPAAKLALMTALEGFFAEWPGALKTMTESDDRAVVQRALGLAAKIQHADFAEPVEAALQHSDPGTRRTAVQTLLSIGTPASMKAIARTIGDEDGEVRTAVYDALCTRPLRAAQKSLGRQLESADLEERDLSERRALFSAFGIAAGVSGVALLEKVLRGKGGLARRPSAETRACAAVALGLIGTPAARLALQEVATDKDPLVRNAASSALRSEAVS